MLFRIVLEKNCVVQSRTGVFVVQSSTGVVLCSTE